MTTRSVTITVSEEIYERVRRLAERAGRSIESEIADLVMLAMPENDDLAPDLANELSALALLDDTSLWRAARSMLPGEVADQMEDLHFKQQRHGLTESESQALALLERQYERTMLIRARAAVLLKERGHDVADIVAER
jgi:hypothetical protein